MSDTYSLVIAIDYTLDGELLDDYNEWLGDHDDTESARKWFLVEKFLCIDWDETTPLRKQLLHANIDPNAKFIYTKAN